MAEAPVLVECPRCEAVVSAVVHGELSWWNEEFLDSPEQAKLAKCPQCHGPLLAGYDYLGSDGDREMWDGPYRLYPPRDKTLSSEVPYRIREAFSEAQRAYRARCFTAAAIMCRKTLEGVAQDQGATAPVLARALKELLDRGVIDARLFEWSEALRALGNAAAHGVELTISREDAEDALHFTEAIADYIFVFKARFEAFNSRAMTKASKRATKKVGATGKVSASKST